MGTMHQLKLNLRWLSMEHGSLVSDGAVKKLGELNVLSYEDILWTTVGKDVFIWLTLVTLKKMQACRIIFAQNLNIILLHPFQNCKRSLQIARVIEQTMIQVLE